MKSERMSTSYTLTHDDDVISHDLTLHKHTTGRRVSVNKNAISYQTLIGDTAGVIVVPLYGYPEPNVTWQHDNVTMAPDSYTTSYVTVEEYSGVTQLKFERVQLTHGGVYTLTGTNTVWGANYTASFALDVDVMYKPIINMTATKHDILEMTREFKIPCYVSSKPAASSITWFFNNADVTTSATLHTKYTLEDMVIEEKDNGMRVSYRTLVIKQARLADAGQYKCVAVNSIGKQFYSDERVVSVDVGK